MRRTQRKASAARARPAVPRPECASRSAAVAWCAVAGVATANPVLSGAILGGEVPPTIAHRRPAPVGRRVTQAQISARTRAAVRRVHRDTAAATIIVLTLYGIQTTVAPAAMCARLETAAAIAAWENVQTPLSTIVVAIVVITAMSVVRQMQGQRAIRATR